MYVHVHICVYFFLYIFSINNLLILDIHIRRSQDNSIDPIETYLKKKKTVYLSVFHYLFSNQATNYLEIVKYVFRNMSSE